MPKHTHTRGRRVPLCLFTHFPPGLEVDLICYKVHTGVPRELETENKLFCILYLA